MSYFHIFGNRIPSPTISFLGQKCVRHGPFDILGGGGLGIFSKKISLLWFCQKKNNIAQWHSEKNNLSPIVYPKLTYRHRQNPKFSSGERSLKTLLTNLNCIKMPARHVKINFQTPCSLVYVLTSSDILYALYPYFTIRMTNIMSKTVLNY